jgi:hypothetical protein
MSVIEKINQALSLKNYTELKNLLDGCNENTKVPKKVVTQVMEGDDTEAKRYFMGNSSVCEMDVAHFKQGFCSTDPVLQELTCSQVSTHLNTGTLSYAEFENELLSAAKSRRNAMRMPAYSVLFRFAGDDVIEEPQFQERLMQSKNPTFRDGYLSRLISRGKLSPEKTSALIAAGMNDFMFSNDFASRYSDTIRNLLHAHQSKRIVLEDVHLQQIAQHENIHTAAEAKTLLSKKWETAAANEASLLLQKLGVGVNPVNNSKLKT